MTAATDEFPREAHCQHMAIMGKTGSGKTYAAKTIVEGLIRDRARVCILDPTGAWWGLRLGPDGKTPALPVVILGGDHADVPINEHAGAAVAELVATQQTQVIIDLSNTRLGERRRFVEHFAERLYERNRGVLHLVIDEADEFAPQSGPPGTERMLGAVDRIVRRGRIKGFRVMMITQRPAVLNKNVLTQANAIIAMRLPASQDRKAIELWVKGQADVEKSAELLGSLAGLKRGEGWVWAPEQGVLRRLHFPRITTFDSGRTPEDGEQVGVHALGELDLSGIKEALGAAIEEAKANDPAELKARIKELEEQLSKVDRGPSPAAVAKIERERDFYRQRLHVVAVAALEHAEQLVSLTEATPESQNQQEATDEHRAVRHVQDTSHAAEAVSGGLHVHDGRRDAERHVDLPSVQRRAGAEAPRASRREAGEALEKGPGLILDAAAWWEALGHPAPTRAQVAAISGYAVSGGSFQRYLSTLSSKGLVTLAEGRVSLTPAGRDAAAVPDTPPTLSELRRRVLDVLESGPRKILEVLLRSPLEMARTQVAELAGFEPSGGTFQRYVSTLSSMELIRYPRRTTIAAATWMGGAETRK